MSDYPSKDNNNQGTRPGDGGGGAVGPVVQCSTLRSSCLALFKQSLQCRSSRSCPSLWTNQRRAGLAAVAVAAAASQLVCSLLYKPISARRRAFTRLTLLGKWVQQIETCSSANLARRRGEREREREYLNFVSCLPWFSLTFSDWRLNYKPETTALLRSGREIQPTCQNSTNNKKWRCFFLVLKKEILSDSATFPQRTNISKPGCRTCRVVDQEFKADFLETISGTKLGANEENKLEKYLIHGPRVQNVSNKQTPMLTLIK